MGEQFDLQNYLIAGVEGIVTEAIRATLKNPRESAFLVKFAAASRAASKKRCIRRSLPHSEAVICCWTITQAAVYSMKSARSSRR